jgi:4-hydroxy-tetrahydrodipicolinate reductase
MADTPPKILQAPTSPLWYHATVYAALGLALGLGYAFLVVSKDTLAADGVTEVYRAARASLLHYRAEKGAWPEDFDLAKAPEAVAAYGFRGAVAPLLEKCAVPGAWRFTTALPAAKGKPTLVFTPAEAGKALVIGTTGHSESEKAAIRAWATKVPIVWASNYSTGVNTLFWLTRKAAEILGPSFDLEVVEMHHRLKKDAPSGTATTLLEILGDVRKVQLSEALRHGREGIVGERTASEIGIHAIRGGDVVGDHTVIFAATGERVELTHKASSRDTFANGAIRAAGWLVGKEPGIYDMQDVLGLK